MLEERGIQPQCESPEDLSKERIINPDKVMIGDAVVYTREDEPDSERQALITEERSNPEFGAINVNTPIAQALLGAFVGEVVEAKLPMGTIRLRIKEIKRRLL
jgi:transcription elongation factor GreA